MKRTISTAWLLVGLLAAAALSGCGEVDLISVPTEREANAVLVALGRAGVVGGTKSKEGGQQEALWVVRVSSEDVTRAREIIAAAGLPRVERAGLAGLAERAGIIPTQTDDRAKFMLAIAQELERTLEGIDGVIEARVTVSLPPTDPLARADADGAKASAAVVIRYQHPFAIEALTLATTIRQTDPTQSERLSQATTVDLVSEAFWRSVESSCGDKFKARAAAMADAIRVADWRMALEKPGTSEDQPPRSRIQQLAKDIVRSTLNGLADADDGAVTVVVSDELPVLTTAHAASQTPTPTVARAATIVAIVSTFVALGLGVVVISGRRRPGDRDAGK